MVLLIALGHGLVVLVAAALWKSRGALIVVAVVMGLIGIATGSPVYAAVDLLAVVLGFWRGLGIINSHEERKRREEQWHYARQARERERSEAAARMPARQESLRTHYDNLQVARNATEPVIKAAYKSLVQRYHPDKFQGPSDEAVRITKILNEAYDVLSDPSRRRAHDEWIKEQLRERETPSTASVESQPPPHRNEEAVASSRRSAPATPSAQGASPSNALGIVFVVAVMTVVVGLIMEGVKGPEVWRPAQPVVSAQPARPPEAAARPVPRAQYGGPSSTALQPQTPPSPLVKLTRSQDRDPQSQAPAMERPTRPQEQQAPALLGTSPQNIAVVPPVTSAPVPPQECHLMRYSSARATCPEASSGELRRLYLGMINGKRDAHDAGFWEARSREVFASTSQCASEDCVRNILYRALDEINTQPAFDPSPG